MSRPQPNQYYTAPDDHEPRTYTSGHEHFSSVFSDFAVMVPANAMIQVSWDLVPENDNRKAERRNCQVHIKDEFGFESTRYRCLGVDKTSGDFVVAFEVSTDKGPLIKEFNLSYMPGGFVEGNGYENPFNGAFGLRYGSYSSKELRIVWSTHKPIRWR
jgi:hypothetical protein